jgi:hypothetical protein
VIQKRAQQDKAFFRDKFLVAFSAEHRGALDDRLAALVEEFQIMRRAVIEDDQRPPALISRVAQRLAIGRDH